MPQEPGEKPQALVIEDHPDIADIFVRSLKDAGFETTLFQDGFDALRYLKTTVPAVVSLDLHLPEISGMDILQEIRDDERLAETRVILVTADQHLAKTVEKDADLVLLKPVSFVQLRDLAARIAAKLD